MIKSRHNFLYFLLIIGWLGGCKSTQEVSSLSFSNVFGNHMVIQRDQPIRIHGRAESNVKVTVKLHHQSQSTMTDNLGRWSVTLESMEAGGPYEIYARTSTASAKLHDVYVGELWVAGGQSNMQYTLDMLGQTEALPALDHSLIRFFNVAIDWDIHPRSSVQGGKWEILSNQTAGRLSAVAYHFAHTLYDSLQVPIGIISSNLGATSIETWISAETLSTFSQFEELLRKTIHPHLNKYELQTILDPYIEKMEVEFFSNDVGMQGKWWDTTILRTSWKSLEVPFINAWSNEDLVSHKGTLWLYKKIGKWPTFMGNQPFLALNQIADIDKVWLNGKEIGQTWGGRIWRNYSFDPDLLKDSNEIVLRIHSFSNEGGLYTSSFWGNPPLTGTWQYQRGDTTVLVIPDTLFLPNASLFTHPSVLYNANIAPLHQLNIRGVIWYQGESNEKRGGEYKKLLSALISDWSNGWGNKNLPFYIVQLASYNAVDTLFNGESLWATIREAQDLASSSHPGGLVSAIDIGDPIDIHPPDKKTIGRRLAWAVLSHDFQKKEAAISPRIVGIQQSDNAILVKVDTNEIAIDPSIIYPGFILAGKDKRFHQAYAEWDGQFLKVTSPKVKKPVALRYAWADHPGVLKLFSQTGLPLLPYRSDDWPLSGEEATFIYEPLGF